MSLGGIISGIGSTVEGALGLAGSGPSAMNVNIPQPYRLPGQDVAAGAYLNSVAGTPGSNLGQWTVPDATQTAQNLYNNPYAPGFQAGASAAGTLGQAGAIQNFGQGTGLQTSGDALIASGQSLLPYAQQLLQLGLDPQSAMYNLQAQQTGQQAMAQEQLSGVGQTPYGAGVYGQTMSDFNINWANTELQRALAGAQGAAAIEGAGTNAMGTGTNMVTAGGNMVAAAPGQYYDASAMPYNAYGQIGQNQFNALTGAQGVASGAQGLYNNPQQQYLSYLGAANASNQVANQNYGLQLGQQNAAYNQNQQNWSNVGSGVAGMTSGMPGTGWGGQINPNPNAYAGYNVTGTPWGG